MFFCIDDNLARTSGGNFKNKRRSFITVI
jgi:hypothetical protein